jgi:large subunit ribosomal protein LX
MSQFTVSGTFEAREGRQAFERSIDAENEAVAREHTLSQFGAEHNLKRTQIEITEVTAA